MDITKDTNCWDYRNCQVKEDCPAHPMFGKLCFSVQGTLCDGQIQGEYKDKIARCRTECEFYQKKMELV